MKSLVEPFNDQTVLITGGAGCIGRNLSETILSGKPKEIVILDDLSSSFEWNIPADPRVFFIKGSILDDEALDTAFSKKPALVFHLAAHFANQNSIEHPETDLLVNGLGTLKVLRRSHLANVRRFVFASSGCSVYGRNAPLPLAEDFVSLHLDTPYQVTKLLGELYCNFFHDYYGLPIVNARFFNVYGPGEVPGRYRNVIPNFIYKALKKEALPITGTGNETRDWTYVDDIVDGILRCATQDAALGRSFNLASGIETTVNEVAKLVNTLAGNDGGVVNIPRRDWDKISKRRASIELASKELGYRPKIPLNEGIKRTIKWISANLRRIDEVHSHRD
jgi:UDP-glucose 4-epimerase